MAFQLAKARPYIKFGIYLAHIYSILMSIVPLVVHISAPPLRLANSALLPRSMLTMMLLMQLLSKLPMIGLLQPLGWI